MDMDNNNNGINFFRCNVCGNTLFAIVDSGVNPDCCAEPMVLLQPNHGGDGSPKHLPVVNKSGNKLLVRVGGEMHPMNVEHRIEWIAVADGRRVDFERMPLKGEPIADFTIRDGSEMLKVYSYCNNDGLWETKVWF